MKRYGPSRKTACIDHHRGLTLLEILIAMVMIVIIVVPIVGSLQKATIDTTYVEARVFAGGVASDTMRALLDKVPFYCIIADGQRDSSSGVKYDELPDNLADLKGRLDSEFNKTDHGSDPEYNPGSHILSRNPLDSEDYMESVLHLSGMKPPPSAPDSAATLPFSIYDERGHRYFISVRAEVVPIKFKYYETTVDSSAKGNTGTDDEWKASFLLDPTDGIKDDHVYGDSQYAASRKLITAGADILGVEYLAGDVKDARLKRLIVTVLWADWSKKRGKSEAEVPLGKFSLVSMKAKLED